MAQKAFISQEAIPGWLEKLAADRTVYVPQNINGTPVFRPFDPSLPLSLNDVSASSAKEAVFPQSQPLLRYAVKKNEEGKHTEIQEEVNEGPALVFGMRPCAARGFRTYDKVFNCERMCDPYYVNRRENTLFVTIACAEPSPACFCTSVGGAPDSDDNSDILLVPVEGGYVARSVTDKGADLLKEASFPEAGDKEAEADAVCEKANETMADATDFSGAPEALEKRFEDIEFWENMTAACINCGACTYLCPTCYCFNITDESDGEYGVRLRTWDSCMFYTYTQEASGHNPRPTKAHRMRNRVGHKFWYFMNQYGEFSCTGCGRCIRHCPNAVDIRRIVQSALNKSGE